VHKTLAAGSRTTGVVASYSICFFRWKEDLGLRGFRLSSRVAEFFETARSRAVKRTAWLPLLGSGRRRRG